MSLCLTFFYHRHREFIITNHHTQNSMQENQGTKIPYDRERRMVYHGSLGKYQQEGNPKKRYMRYDTDRYTHYQNFLYKQALYGLNIYSAQEQAQLSRRKKKEIIKRHRRVQDVMNIWKQEITNKLCNFIFRNFFPKAPLSRDIRSKYTFTHVKYKNELSFKTLRLTKDQIVDKLIREKLLPENFHQLRKKPENLEQHGSTFHSKRRGLSTA